MSETMLFDDGQTPESRQPQQTSGRLGKPRAGDIRECRACGQELVFARTKDGKLAPITLNAKPGGNVLVFKSFDGLVECRSFAAGPGMDALREQAVPLRLNHFADCPRADEFKKQRIRSAA
jgi:hypothetical protein